MTSLFDRLWKFISILLGLFLLAIGGVWILQGLNIAFLDSFMAGDIRWTYRGAGLALFGLLHTVWSLRRKT